MILIFLEKLFTQNIFDIRLANLNFAFIIGTADGKVIVTDVCFEGLNQAVFVKQMPTFIQSLKLFIVETSVADFAWGVIVWLHYIFLLSIEFLLHFSCHLYILILNFSPVLLNDLIQFLSLRYI
jgi:hypothetical protein